MVAGNQLEASELMNTGSYRETKQLQLIK